MDMHRVAVGSRRHVLDRGLMEVRSEENGIVLHTVTSNGFVLASRWKRMRNEDENVMRMRVRMNQRRTQTSRTMKRFVRMISSRCSGVQTRAMGSQLRTKSPSVMASTRGGGRRMGRKARLQGGGEG